MKKQEKTVRETKKDKLERVLTLLSKDKKQSKIPLKKFHLTAKIQRTITYENTKTGKLSKYNEADHKKQLKGHDTLIDSRVVEARTLEEAKQIMRELLEREHFYKEYSSSAKVQLDDIEFI